MPNYLYICIGIVGGTPKSTTSPVSVGIFFGLAQAFFNLCAGSIDLDFGQTWRPTTERNHPAESVSRFCPHDRNANAVRRMPAGGFAHTTHPYPLPGQDPPRKKSPQAAFRGGDRLLNTTGFRGQIPGDCPLVRPGELPRRLGKQAGVPSCRIMLPKSRCTCAGPGISRFLRAGR